MVIPTVKQLNINDVCCPCPDLAGLSGVAVAEGKHIQGMITLKEDRRSSSRRITVRRVIDDRTLAVSRTSCVPAVGLGQAIGSTLGLDSGAGTGIGGIGSGIGMESGSGSARRMSESTVRRASVQGQKSDTPVFNQLAKLNSFCTWECAKKFICNFTSVTHKDYLNLLIDILAGYKVHA